MSKYAPRIAIGIAVGIAALIAAAGWVATVLDNPHH